MKETTAPAEPTPVGGLARSSRHGSPAKTTASIRATSRMADILGPSMASDYRALESRVPDYRPGLGISDHCPGKPGDALCGRFRRGQLHRSYAGDKSFMDRNGRATQATRVQRLRGNEDAPCYSWKGCW